MKIVCISDSHRQHDKLTLPEGDMILHAGDISGRGRKIEMEEFLEWFSALPYQYKVFIAGNHDFFAEKNRAEFRQMIPNNCIYLEDSGVEIEGIHIWGSPITPWFYDWAFNRHRGMEIRPHWNKIPLHTDILITHGPPHDILDRTASGIKAGCEDLSHKIAEVRPRLHLFGHIHEAYGQRTIGETTYINASVLDLKYQQVNDPVVFEW
ncbi:MAG: metallophosphatase domain-containing protein [Bacteroidetes bacterium]|nr:metallophosphatase domain-containing protein [Bacteroidota bacterium]